MDYAKNLGLSSFANFLDHGVIADRRRLLASIDGHAACVHSEMMIGIDPGGFIPPCQFGINFGLPLQFICIVRMSLAQIGKHIGLSHRHS